MDRSSPPLAALVAGLRRGADGRGPAALADGGRAGEVPGLRRSGNAHQQRRKLDVVYTQAKLRGIKKRDLRTAIRANQTDNSVVIEGFSKDFSNDIFRLLLSDSSVRASTLSLLSYMEISRGRSDRKRALVEFTYAWQAGNNERESILNERAKTGKLSEREYKELNDMRDLAVFIRKWARKPGEGVVYR